MLRWRGRGLDCPDQVANARDSTVNLDPVSELPAARVLAGWAATLPWRSVPAQLTAEWDSLYWTWGGSHAAWDGSSTSQPDVPLIWERVTPDGESCDDS